MYEFLDISIPGIRCMNFGCRAEATAENPITFRMLLYDGWVCSYCGTVHYGALASSPFFDFLHKSEEVEPVAEVVVEEVLTDEEVEEAIDELAETPPEEEPEEVVEEAKPACPDGLKKMNKPDLLECALELDLDVSEEMTKKDILAAIEEATE